MKKIFKLVSSYTPAGDQPTAIDKLSKAKNKKSLLLGVTGSGKTFTMANVIAKQSSQVLILSPNKTLAAQLFEEFSRFFPENKVCYFVSYFDYYQPESYIPSSDTYIPKDSKVNAEIERLRVESTASLINREDTIVIASVSAIYSLGNPLDYKNLAFKISLGQKTSRKELIQKLIDLQYSRNDSVLDNSSFQVIGGKINLILPYVNHGLRIEVDDDKISKLYYIDKKNFDVQGDCDNILIFPAKHFTIPKNRLENATQKILADLELRLSELTDPVIKTRLESRVKHDVSMMLSTGYCEGIENYSSYLDERNDLNRPFCLLDFFKKDFLFIIDESHIAVPQLGAMFKGDQSRKQNLIDFGFRLPSAKDNRPLKFEEVEGFFSNTIFVSATPSDYELKNSSVVAEQIVRPTGIIDPLVFIHPRENQLVHLLGQIKETIQKGFRSLVTVLTKKFAEELAVFLEGKGLKVCYLHSEIKTTERTEIINKLRSGEFDVLVGINLLREGLDLPEVAFLAILDADIEGFLRNERSLIQTIGRAARNTESIVYLYADKITDSMKRAMDETTRRRSLQESYNKMHGIKPKSTERIVQKSISKQATMASYQKSQKPRKGTDEHKEMSVDKLKKMMIKAAKDKNFTKAIELREIIKKLELK